MQMEETCLASLGLGHMRDMFTHLHFRVKHHAQVPDTTRGLDNVAPYSDGFAV